MIGKKPMSPEDLSIETEALCSLAPVIPVLVIDDAAKAQPLGRALVKGGLPALEVTLRTPAALDAIRGMSEIEGAVVGAGTILNPDDMVAAIEAGATFGVSPGATDRLLDACEEAGFPILPGASTATEVMKLLDRGYTVQKFFPAEASGGAPALKAIAGPLPQVKFCPTGGITAEKALDYLALPNTICVGGSWVAPKEAVETYTWSIIRSLAQESSKLPR